MFIQLVALVSPLFFQVVIDKVLVHRGLTTLEVLVIGLLVVNLADALLNWLRTYAFAHTTSRMDAILGSQLFRHLIALPIGYFESRATGQTVARVRELENVRQFITSSALTLVIDVVFGLIFLAVMFWYSPPLTLAVVISIPFYAVISVVDHADPEGAGAGKVPARRCQPVAAGGKPGRHPDPEGLRGRAADARSAGTSSSPATSARRCGW